MTPTKEPSPFRLRTLQLQERTFKFAKRVIDACPQRMPDGPSGVLWNQLVRAAPSASGNLEEADEASSDADFIFKMKITLRETKESRKWLRFIVACKLENHHKLGDLEDEARQLASIFATIIVKVKARLAAQKAKERRCGKTALS